MLKISVGAFEQGFRGKILEVAFGWLGRTGERRLLADHSLISPFNIIKRELPPGLQSRLHVKNQSVWIVKNHECPILTAECPLNAL